MTVKLIIYLLFSVLFVSACDLVEYSPNQVFDRNSPQQLNKKNLARLNQNAIDDTIRFVLTGDSQLQYEPSRDLVDVVNAIPGVDFVLLAGDISDFGLLGEMEWINEIFSLLDAPYIGVIGNHDLVANGEKVYKRMFGPLNFSFIYGGTKFVCHNTNSREYNFDGKVPDLNWLSAELAPSAGVNAYITVAHVPPFSNDFDEALKSDYITQVNSSPNTLAALFAHDHKEDLVYPTRDRIPYFTTNSIGKRQFLLFEIVNGILSYESISY